MKDEKERQKAQGIRHKDEEKVQRGKKKGDGGHIETGFKPV